MMDYLKQNSKMIKIKQEYPPAPRPQFSYIGTSEVRVLLMTVKSQLINGQPCYNSCGCWLAAVNIPCEANATAAITPSVWLGFLCFKGARESL